MGSAAPNRKGVKALSRDPHGRLGRWVQNAYIQGGDGVGSGHGWDAGGHHETGKPWVGESAFHLPMDARNEAKFQSQKPRFRFNTPKKLSIYYQEPRSLADIFYAGDSTGCSKERIGKGRQRNYVDQRGVRGGPGKWCFVDKRSRPEPVSTDSTGVLGSRNRSEFGKSLGRAERFLISPAVDAVRHPGLNVQRVGIEFAESGPDGDDGPATGSRNRKRVGCQDRLQPASERYEGSPPSWAA